MRTLAIVAMGFMLVAFVLGLLTTGASWATADVQSCAVPGDFTSIQAAVDEASCEEIDLDTTTFYPTQSVTISRTVKIRGRGVDQTIVDGQQDLGAIFHIEASGVVTLTGMTIRNLDAGFGSAILNDGITFVADCALNGNSAYFGAGILNRDGTMVVTDSTLSNNSANFYGGGYGGGIVNAGTMTVTNSTLSNNTAEKELSSGGGIGNDGILTLINSTISGNASNATGGGIANAGTMTVLNSTLTDNNIAADQTTGGGGIYNNGQLVLQNSLIANNEVDDCHNLGTITSLGYNLDSDGSCNLIGVDDQPSTAPLLGPLQDNGGPTLTHALLEGSPAIDAGGEDCPDTDQRGVPRPQDGDGDGNAWCDIGAFELGKDNYVLLPLLRGS